MSDRREIPLETGSAGVARATINLRFVHPTIDPAEITERLGLVPTLTRRITYPLLGTDGTVQPEVAHQTRWVLTKSYYEPEPPAGEEDPPFDVNGHLGELVEHLARERAFVRQLAAGGEASIDIGLPGQQYIGFVVDPPILAKIAEAGLGFGIEVFPDSAS